MSAPTANFCSSVTKHVSTSNQCLGRNVDVDFLYVLQGEEALNHVLVMKESKHAGIHRRKYAVRIFKEEEPRAVRGVNMTTV